MIRFLAESYSKRQIRFLLTLVSTMARDVEDECKYRKRKCELCEYHPVCSDLHNFERYLKSKSFEN